MPEVENPPRGESVPKNFIILHQRCNRLRGQLPYDEMIEKKTKLVENMQKYFDRVIEFINAGKMNARYDYYPEEAARTLSDESSGVINIDTVRAKASGSRPVYENLSFGRGKIITYDYF